MIYYIGLGSNQNKRKSIAKAANLIRPLLGDLRTSRVYRTAPIGRPEQPDYFNAVWAGTSDCSEEELEAELKEIEKKCGRVRNPKDKYAARTMDLDLLGWDNFFVDEDEINQRSFLAAGLIDLNAALMERFNGAERGEPMLIETEMKEIIESCWNKENLNHE